MRGLRRAPLTTVVIMLTVGLGIGATTIIFAAVDAALLRSLPYADADRLVRIYTDAPPNKFPFSVADYLALQSEQSRFEQIAAYTGRAMAYTNAGVTERLPGKAVSWTYFSVLGIKPALGRDFTDADGKPGGPLGRDCQPRVLAGAPRRPRGRHWTAPFSSMAAITLWSACCRLPSGRSSTGQEFFVAAQFATPPRKGPFFLTVARTPAPDANRATAADELRAINRRLFPSGAPPIRTIRRPGA